MDIKLLEKFYRGACSEEEVKEVLSWFDAKSDKESVLQHLQTYWLDFEEPEEEVSQHNQKVLLSNIHARLRKEGEMEVKKDSAKLTHINQYYYLRVAAIMVLAFGLSFLMQKLMHDENITEVSSWIVKEVARGERQSIRLPDGTLVTLNAESRLSYPKHFLEKTREVMLEGEAFFDVARDEKHPFIVRSGDIYTTVLGTSFNIKAYADESVVTVSVASGKVKVHSNPAGQAHDLSSGREAVYQTNQQVFTVQDFEVKDRIAWKEEILYFKDASFEDVKKALERWYDIDIQVTDRDHQDWQYSGTFQRQSLEDVLLSIGYVKHFTYEINGKQVKIAFNNP